MEIDQKNRILLLEDDEGLVDGLCYSLKKSGYEVETAGVSGKQRNLWHTGSMTFCCWT